MRPCGCPVSDREDAECRKIAAASAKEEERTAERIEVEHRLHLRREAVEAPPHVGHAAGDVDPHAGRQRQHRRPSSTDSTRRKAASSTEASTRKDTPLDSTISITLLAGGADASGNGGCATTAASLSGDGAASATTWTGRKPDIARDKACLRQV